MNRTSRIVKVAVVAALVVGVALLVVKGRKTHALVTETADDIEAQLDSLDPVVRAAVVTKLSADAVKQVKARRS